ncbi:MAG TPA: RNA methyltransferase [Clostridia bacterium]|nr:RNA methyltransferase [Clostridia bacterium]
MSTGFEDRLRPITSRQNSLVKDLRKAFTHAETTEDGYCAIEGVRIIEEAIRSGLRFKAVFVSESAQERAKKLLPQLAAQVELLLVPDEVFQSAVPTETPQGIAALVKLKSFDFKDVLRSDDALILAAAGLQDPGNLGTIIRSAEAFGAAGVVLAEKTVSAYNPKVVRASAGSLFRLPVLKVPAADALATMRGRGMRILATSSHKGVPLDEADLTGGLAIFVGSEGAGVPKDIIGAADETIAIPQSPRVESLNAGIAASIVLYEAARQRRG